MRNWIQRHFTVSSSDGRTDKQLHNETYLLPGLIKFNRYQLLPAAIAIQMCVGSLYAWSGFNIPIETRIFGENRNAAGVLVDRNISSVTFYVAVGVFGITTAFFGPVLERRGPRFGAVFGSILFFVAHLISSLGVQVRQIGLVYIGYGLFGGIGLGMCYISPVSPLQKWFIERRGAAAGLAVCGFGAGSILAPFLQKWAITALGLPLAFVFIGSIYFVVMSISALVLRMPPPNYIVDGMSIDTIKGASPHTPLSMSEKGETSESQQQQQPEIKMTLIESLASPEYILLWFTFLGNEITGLLIISKIQSIVTNQLGKDSTTAATINSLIGVCNLCGRLFVPALSDLVGRKVCFLISFLVQSILLGILPTFLNNSKYEAVLTCFFGIAFFYGGGFGVIPAFLADLFGGKNVGATHGCILLAWSLGAVVGGTVFNHLLSVESVRLGPAGIVRIYDLNFRWILVIVLLCAFLCSWVPVEVEERFGEKRKGVWFTKSVPFFGIVPIGIPKK